MRIIHYLLINLLFATPVLVARAGDKIDYNVSGIPAALQTNADVVLRLDETRFEITAIDRARQYHHYAITILNERGDKHAEMAENYSKLFEIESIIGTLYDANGKKVRSLKKQDISDYSATGNNFMTDRRVKVHNFYCKMYPYTVEYEIVEKYNFTMFFPGWEPQSAENYAVQESKITVVCPTGYKFRYKAFNYTKEPVIQTEKSTTSYTWEVTNLPATENEFASPPREEITPTVMFAPEQFEMESYQGNMKTWQDFGKFVYALKAGKDALPDDVKQKVHQLTDTVSDPREKVRLLYEFMQQNTHYILVSLGIGGWQPFDAKYVADKKYGDCKALANYMYSLLKEAGIRSCYTLINGDWNSRHMVDDFPSSQFNHAILCVPQPKDSIWLECTSQTLPAGYLSAFTADRYALLVNEDGGRLVRTPKYNRKDNLQSRHTAATIDGEGNLTTIIHTQYRAERMDRLEEMINELSKDKVMNLLKSELDLPTYDINKFDYREEKSAMPSIYETLDLVAPGYAQVSGKRIFINPNIMNRSRRKLRVDESRKYDIVTFNEFEDIDTTEIKIPTGYKLEAINPAISVESPFGHYTASIKVENDKILYYRRLEKYSGRWPAAVYPEMVKFYEQLYKADNSRIVLVKKE